MNYEDSGFVKMALGETPTESLFFTLQKPTGDIMEATSIFMYILWFKTT